MPGDPERRGSALFLEELFEAGDPRFLEELRRLQAQKKLATFADRWKRDARPFARAQILAYLELPFDVPGHQPVVKRLFKNAEAARDDEVMGAFLVAFDGMVRRVRKTQGRWNRETRTYETFERLVSPRDAIPSKETRRARNPMTGEEMSVRLRAPKGARLFSYHTRYHLRRRAWRYFRQMGFKRPDAYPAAIAAALARFRDEDLARGENILDSWGLVHALFGKHDALAFGVSKIDVKAGRAFSELAPAPAFPEAWRAPASLEILLDLLVRAKARAVRVFAMALARREHAAGLAGLAPERVLGFLDSADEEVQQFGAELLDRLSGLEKLPVSQWLKLLQTKSITALETVCACLERHVRPERLDLSQCVELVRAEPVSVARLGLRYLKTRTIKTAADRQTLARVADARCAAVSEEIAAHAFSILGEPKAYHRDLVTPFFDSLQAGTRRAAWTWLISERGRPGYDDALLWVRFIETPFEDLRLRLVTELEKRQRAPFAGPGELAPVWCAVLLGVHRGGREKAKAVRQIGRALAEDPSQAANLLPILAVAIRSIRGPEARAGLSALLTAAAVRPELEASIARVVPELKLATSSSSPGTGARA